MWVVIAKPGRFANLLVPMWHTGPVKYPHSRQILHLDLDLDIEKPNHHPHFKPRKQIKHLQLGFENSASQLAGEKHLSWIRDQMRNTYQTWGSLSWASQEGNMVNYKTSKRREKSAQLSWETRITKEEPHHPPVSRGCSANRMLHPIK